MKILHLSGSISRKAGGLFYSVRRLAQEQLAQGCDVEVVGLEDEFSSSDAGLWAPLKPHVMPVKSPLFWGYAPGLRAKLDELRPDVVHSHGLWLYNSCLLSRWAGSTGVKYVVSPRGMLDAWALHNAGLKKKIAGMLYEKVNLNKADCVHALTDKEVADIRAYGVGSDICVVPNGVDLPEERLQVAGSMLHGEGKVVEVEGSRLNEEMGREEVQGSGGKWQVAEGGSKARVLLYIGRLHPKKGLDSLMQAWALSKKQLGESAKWRLVIAGWDDGGHERKLKSIVAGLGIESEVSFAGPVYGDVKDELLRNAHAFILPSLSEGLPMSVLEAWAYGLPVLMTRECNLSNGFETGAAVEIGSDPVSISEGLGRLFAMPEDKLVAMGRQGQALAGEQYAWTKLAGQLIEVYAWLLSGKSKPECVV